MEMKLEVVFVPVSDVDRAKAFYEKVGWRLDIDYAPNEKFRVIQFTPPQSHASIIFGRGITTTKTGSAGLVLAVDDVDTARADLMARGAKVSEAFHYASGRSTTPRRIRASLGATRKVGPITRLPRLRIQTETAGSCRKSRRDFPVVKGSRCGETPRTSQPLASFSVRRRSTMATTRKRMSNITGGIGTRPYLSARQSGSSPEQAAAAADRYMDDVHHIPSR